MKTFCNSIKSLCTKKKYLDDFDMKGFLEKKLPIFWFMGPPGCGKTTLAEMLAKSSNYHLIFIENLINEEILRGQWRSKIIVECKHKNQEIPSDIILTLLLDEFVHTCENSIGYIIVGFPSRLKQARLFEKRICKVNLIVYVVLELDGLLSRRIMHVGPFDPNEERIKYIRHKKRLHEVAKKYDSRTIKISSNYPPEDTCTRLVENLEDFWGYKFLRLYNKNQ